MQYLVGLRRHFIAIPALGLAYGRVPKVANSTLKRQLARAAGLEDRFDGGYSRDAEWRGLAPDALLLTGKELRRRFPDMFVFSFVREPLACLASCYRSKITRPGQLSDSFLREGLAKDTSFPEFVAHAAGRSDWRSNIHYRAQAHVLCRDGALIPDFVGRFETLREDWKKLTEIMADRGVALPKLPHRGDRQGARPQMRSGDLFDGDETLMALARRRAPGQRLARARQMEPPSGWLLQQAPLRERIC